MTKYEVRVVVSQADYYHVDAPDKETACEQIRQRLTTDKVTYGTKVDTIKHNPQVTYALELDEKGEVIL
tara:strand:- start:73 stop:279 length:207 start_codon:yes stop_codon:yes gene_type:complete